MTTARHATWLATTSASERGQRRTPQAGAGHDRGHDGRARATSQPALHQRDQRQGGEHGRDGPAEREPGRRGAVTGTAGWGSGAAMPAPAGARGGTERCGGARPTPRARARPAPASVTAQPPARSTAAALARAARRARRRAARAGRRHAVVRSRIATPRGTGGPAGPARSPPPRASPRTATTRPSPPVRVSVGHRAGEVCGARRGDDGELVEELRRRRPPRRAVQPAGPLVEQEPDAVALPGEVHRDGRRRTHRPLEGRRRALAAVAVRADVEQDRRAHLPRLLVAAHHELARGARSSASAPGAGRRRSGTPGWRCRPRRSPRRCGPATRRCRTTARRRRRGTAARSAGTTTSGSVAVNERVTSHIPNGSVRRSRSGPTRNGRGRSERSE